LESRPYGCKLGRNCTSRNYHLKVLSFRWSSQSRWQPRYKQPCGYGDGPQSVALSDLCRMYLWRFSIEHLFRFSNNTWDSTPIVRHLVSAQQWMWICALAYWQLLLMRIKSKQIVRLVSSKTDDPSPHSFPGVTFGVGIFLELGTPAATPRPTGKGIGRQRIITRLRVLAIRWFLRAKRFQYHRLPVITVFAFSF